MIKTNSNYELLLAALCFASGQILVWIQLNSQFIWEWWRNKAVLPILIYSMPAAFCFWHATRYAVGATNSLWAGRFLAFGISYITFPLLTYYLAGESMFTPKTLFSSFLAFIIIGVQVFWK
jgi:hypothetical protein